MFTYTNITVTKPVAQTLDILQGEKNVFYGMVMLSLFLLQKKLQSLSEMKWKYCKPIVQCLQNSLESFFKKVDLSLILMYNLRNPKIPPLYSIHFLKMASVCTF